MRKRITVTTLMILVFILAFTSVSFTQSYSRNIRAWFNNIKVYLDGELLSTDNEPFIYDNEIYVPISDLADMLYINYHYDEEKQRLDIATNGRFDIDPETSAAALSYQRYYEVAALNRQIAELQKEIEILRSGRFPYRRITNLTEMEDYLEEFLGDLEGIPMAVQLHSQGEDQYLLTAAFPSESLSKWHDLDRRTIENWIDDLLFAIQELYNPDATIEGTIRSNRFTGTTYTSFYTRGNYLYFDFQLAQHKESDEVDGVKLQDSLDKYIRSYHDVAFTYEVFVNHYDVDLMIYFNDDDFYDWSPSIKMQYLKKVEDEIADYNESITVNGKIIDNSSNAEETVFRFNFEEGNIHSVDLLEELEDYLGEHFGEFEYDNDEFNFTYTIYENDSDTFEVIMEGDFSKLESEWRDAEEYGEYSFRSFVEEAFEYIEGLWSVDIYGEVRDENYEHICDVEFYSIDSSSSRRVQPIIFQ